MPSFPIFIDFSGVPPLIAGSTPLAVIKAQLFLKRAPRVTFATDRQLLSYYTQQTHKAPDTRSNLLYKDVLRDQARVVWRGVHRVLRRASIIPVKPPVINVETNPIENNIAGLSCKLPFHKVVI